MQAEMSLAESLINAIISGRVHGIQVTRKFGTDPGDERRAFEDLTKVIGNRLDGARRVAVDEALRKLDNEHPRFRTVAELGAKDAEIAKLRNALQMARTELCWDE